jgi:hypothetical protein
MSGVTAIQVATVADPSVPRAVYLIWAVRACSALTSSRAPDA